MVRIPNPFHPGFNQAPEVLAGRESVLASVRESLDEAALDGRTPRPHIIIGSRGVGKTVLLGEIAEKAASVYGWPTAFVEARPDAPLTALLIERLTAVAAVLREARREREFRIQSFTAEARALVASAQVNLSRTSATEAVVSLEGAYRDACAAAVDKDCGLVLAIDELQWAGRAEVGELAAVLQQHVPEGWPIVVVLAGLANLREPDRTITYLERAAWHEIGLLDEADTRLALSGPASQAGRPMDDDALALLSTATGGYPYAVQLFGLHAWRASTGATAIAAEHARAAIPVAEAELALSLYSGRWEDASPREREYLAVVAELLVNEGRATGGEAARVLGGPPAAFSSVRDRLLKKGTLIARGRDLHLPVPGMATWIAQRVASDR